MKNFCHVEWQSSCTQRKEWELPDDSQELRPKHAVAIINKRKHCGTIWFLTLRMKCSCAETVQCYTQWYLNLECNSYHPIPFLKLSLCNAIHTDNRTCHLPAPSPSTHTQFYPVFIPVYTLLFWILKRINNSPCDVNSTLHSLQTTPCYNSWQLHFSLEGGQPSRMAKQVSSDVMLVPVRLPILQAVLSPVSVSLCRIQR